MMFRRLYWVLEEVRPDGTSFLNGVFTSVPDLGRNGFHRLEAGSTGFRLNLTQLDTDKGPLGTWTGGQCDQMTSDLQPFVQRGEISDEECRDLCAMFSERALAV